MSSTSIVGSDDTTIIPDGWKFDTSIETDRVVTNEKSIETEKVIKKNAESQTDNDMFEKHIRNETIDKLLREIVTLKESCFTFKKK